MDMWLLIVYKYRKWWSLRVCRIWWKSLLPPFGILRNDFFFL